MTSSKARKDRLLWVISLIIATGAHLLVLLYILSKPTQPVNAKSSAAAPIVVTIAAISTTAHSASIDSVAQQANEPPPQVEDAPVPPSLPLKLHAAVKEIKSAKVKVAVNDTKPKLKHKVEHKPKPKPKHKVEHKPKPKPKHKVEHKPKPKPESKKQVVVRQQPKKITKPAEITTPETTRSNSSELVAKKNQAQRVGAASNQLAALKQSWQSEILAKLQKMKRYPGYALRMKQQDTVLVRFFVDRDGNVLDSSIVKSKGYASLDRESLQLLDRVTPLPKPPASAFVGNLDRIELIVPISFTIRNS
ncbi:energy transducer TonB [Marinomonas spartinae]|uniref:energy transducer TonB n=1 Tax=Marinomonas spartinae TaxID=1792290 RepID=UPI0018F11CB1|nr:TonB family protein [Marinomonas spartinae]MBJ7556580.1 energy transducer TonB [Marinomonas spartinae]